MARSTDSFNLPGPRGAASSGESYSYRGSELTKAQRAEIKSQNRAAESLKTKDLDKVESGQKAAQTREYGIQQREEYAHSQGVSKGLKAGVAAGVTGGAIAGAVAQKAVDKSTQSGNVRHRDYRKPVDK